MTKVAERKPLQQGVRFGRWTVVERGEDKVTSRRAYPTYLCTCDCGNIGMPLRSSLEQGLSKSCGCLAVEARSLNGKANKTHGKSSTKAYTAWVHMHARCNDMLNEDYGGRGISVAEEWHNLNKFLDDMGEPAAGQSLDRIDTNKGYSKENCRWVTQQVQVLNTRKRKDNSTGRTGVYLTASGKYKVLIQYNGVTYSGGVFADFDSAVRSREKLEIKYHGRKRPDNYEYGETYESN